MSINILISFLKIKSNSIAYIAIMKDEHSKNQYPIMFSDFFFFIF